ncbi:hypothetical protein PFISCL1PPCAC_24018, partial [Pristionchus fissidentatus]
MIRNAREEERQEAFERAKYEARTTFADALMQAKRSIHRTEEQRTKMNLQRLIEREEAWIESEKNPSNEDLIARGRAVRTEVALLM